MMDCEDLLMASILIKEASEVSDITFLLSIVFNVKLRSDEFLNREKRINKLISCGALFLFHQTEVFRSKI